MDLEGLESFLTIAEKKSISKAAATLHITQPTLSTRLRKLEEGLGFQLVQRSWNGVNLTDQGHYFLPYAIQLLRELGNASTILVNTSKNSFTSFNEVTTNDQEHFLIGINRWLAPMFTNTILTELNTHFPNLNFKFITKPTDTLKDLIQYDSIHVGIYYQNQKKTNLYSEPLLNDEMVLICSDEDRSFIQDDFNKLKLLPKPFLLFDNPILANNRQIIDRIIKRINVNKYKIVDDIGVMMTYLTSNQGYAILPRSALHQFSNSIIDSISTIPLGKDFPTIDIHMEYNQKSPFISPIKAISNKLSSYCNSTHAS